LKKNDFIVFNTRLGNIIVYEEKKNITGINFTTGHTHSSHSNLLNKAKLELTEYLKKNRTKFSFNVLPRGTLFQYSVWKEIKKISYGSTKTYLDLAKTIGTSPRAIGNACAKNKCLILIPCHRVIALNGELKGFSALGGIKTKRQLISIEK